MKEPPALFLLTAIFACVLSGCGDSERSKLVGTWVISKPKAIMSRIAQGSVELESDTEGAKSEEPKMLLSFQSNGVVKTKTAMGAVDQEKTGSWEMMSHDGTANTMKISCEIKGQNSEHVVTFVDEDTIELVPPNMAGLTTKIKFNRQ